MALNNHVENFTLDMAPGGIAPVLNVSQGDTGRAYTADMYWGGASYDVSGLTVRLRGRKRDNTVFDYALPAPSGTKVSFDLEDKEQVTIIPGNVECELVFTDSDSRVVGTANFVFIVEEAPYDPNAISESEVTGLVDLISDQIGGAVDDWMETEAPTSPEFAASMQTATDRYLDENGVAVSWDSVTNKPNFDGYFENIVGVTDLLFSASWIDNAYVDGSGVPHDLTGFHYTDLIPVEIGENYSFVYKAGTTNNTIRIVGYNASDTFTSVLAEVASTNDGREHTIVFTATDCAKIRVSMSKVHTPLYIVKGENFDNLQSQINQLNREKMDSIGNFTIDFSDYDNGFVTGSNGIEISGGWKHTKPFFVPKGGVITVSVFGYNDAPVFWEYYDGAYNWLTKATATGVNTFTYTAPKSGYYGLNFNTKYSSNGSVSSDYNLPEELEQIKAKTEIPYLSMFHKIAVLGDSLSSGEIHDGATVIDCYKYSWLSNIARSTGADFVHYSRGGMTTKEWWNNGGGYKAALADEADKPTAYYIAFGTNDKNQSVYGLGTASDTAGSDTFAGYLKAIIEYVHAQQANAVVFLVSTYNTSTASTPYNEMIESIAELYDYCLFIDYAHNGTIQTTQSNMYVENSHFTTLGYVYVSNIIKELTEEAVNDNLEWFKHFGLYNYEV